MSYSVEIVEDEYIKERYNSEMFKVVIYDDKERLVMSQLMTPDKLQELSSILFLSTFQKMDDDFIDFMLDVLRKIKNEQEKK